MAEEFSKRVKNTEGKGEIARYDGVSDKATICE